MEVIEEVCISLENFCFLNMLILCKSRTLVFMHIHIYWGKQDFEEERFHTMVVETLLYSFNIVICLY